MNTGQTSFTIDSRLNRTLESLKSHYGAESKADIITKAIALLNLVARYESADGSLTIRHHGDNIKVILK